MKAKKTDPKPVKSERKPQGHSRVSECRRNGLSFAIWQCGDREAERRQEIVRGGGEGIRGGSVAVLFLVIVHIQWETTGAHDTVL
ncbi:hypothetical protein BHE74_00055635 [Ensete ventricosum]|nr:hypothetical protein BHE74_00055635 [Ensete ventricosum]RZS24902.1 hypothetical protein BHM03_00058028 [Ensete ventricosum]